MRALLIIAACVLAVSWATPLDDYVNAPDNAFNVTDMNIRYDAAGWTAYVYNVTSQHWLTAKDSNRFTWWHYYVLVVPDNVVKNFTTGLQYITGGENDDGPPTINSESLQLTAELAVGAGMVAGVLYDVPNQPIEFPSDPWHKSRIEDSAIAFTWWRFMHVNDHQPNWILELPMTKAGVKGLDALQIVAKARVGMDIKTFYVAGASKRGWTTWLVGAVDKRVTAIIPIVLDALHLLDFLNRQFRFYGNWSFALEPYYAVNFTKDLGTLTPRMEKLASIVDPYVYRNRLTMPKLAINAGGDEFQMPDDQRYWAHNMPGEMNLLMVKNADHTLATGLHIVVEGAGAFLQANIHKYARPNYTWSICEKTGEITFETDTAPYAVDIAYGFSANHTGLRDFRWAALNVEPCPKKVFGACLRELPWLTTAAKRINVKKYTALVDTPKTGWVAFFIEARWANPTGIDDFYFTSAASVLPFTDPFPQCKGAECRGDLV